MNRNGRKIILALAAALALSGCGGAVEKTGNDNVGAAAQSNVNASNPASTLGGANVASANAAAVPMSSPMTVSSATQQNTNQGAVSRAASKEPPAKMPAPQIGSGGNDFFLFTQMRAAVNADPELRAANVTIDVKDGVLTLSGKVASAAQKSKAEQLVRDAGAKTVKNQLRVGGN